MPSVPPGLKASMISDLGGKLRFGGRSGRGRAPEQPGLLPGQVHSAADTDYRQFSDARATRVEYLINPKEYIGRVRLEYLRRDLPRADARWLGRLLARLSPSQIRDAFRAAGYSPEEIEGFAGTLEKRITMLADL